MELRDDPIVLRPWREDDASAVHAACQDRDIQHWMPVIPRPYTHDDARAFVSGDVGPDHHLFAIAEHGRVVGSVGLRVNDSNTGRIGYWCASAARGRGITTRALRRLCRYGLDELGLDRLELITDVDNFASQRVAAKAGFRREGVLRSHLVHPDGRRRDSVMFSLLPGELSRGAVVGIVVHAVRLRRVAAASTSASTMHPQITVTSSQRRPSMSSAATSASAS